ncbi:MAG: type II secretion system protein [bacterium]|nr:type II secretion system protein [bacterium]
MKLAGTGSGRARSAFTLVELLVVVSIIGLLVSILIPTLSKAREQARSIKCLANLHGFSVATMTYATDQNDFLPGPLHPAVVRNTERAGVTQQDRKKSLAWLLRPYFGSGSAVNQASKQADEFSTCPTAPFVAPDEDFGGVKGVPFSYSVNSFGPLNCPMSSSDTGAQWFHTDPPYYFGCWYYYDDWPDSSAMASYYYARMWKPKNIARIRMASAEWSVGDAWYRRVKPGATRPGTVRDREVLGTFPSVDSGSPLPSMPFHGVSSSDARATRHTSAPNGVLPKIPLKGWTNLAFFDGHAESFSGTWLRKGEGGTINAYWDIFQGKRSHYGCP